MLKVISLDQNLETPVSLVSGDYFNYRFAYARSADTIKSDTTGQDALTIREEGERIAFVLCDGVSQSFYGNLAARFLAEELNLWLWENADSLLNSNEISEVFAGFLNRSTENASRIVSSQSLPDDVAPMLRAVLEKKRGLGSESTFVAGCLDAGRRETLFAWMGDSRLRIWGIKGEIDRNIFGIDAFKTQERWSTSKGLVGDLHFIKIDLDQIHHVMVYSDGLARLDAKIRMNSPSNHTLSQIIAESGRLAASDDISYLEIWPGFFPDLQKTSPKAPAHLRVKTQPNNHQLVASWNKVNHVDEFEIAIHHPKGWQLFTTQKNSWEIAIRSLPINTSAVSIRSWSDENASDWSRTQPVSIPDPSSMNSTIMVRDSGLYREQDQSIIMGGDIYAPGLNRPSKRHRSWLLPVLVLIEVGLICLASLVLSVGTNKIIPADGWISTLLPFGQSSPVQVINPDSHDRQEKKFLPSATHISIFPTQTGTEKPKQIDSTPAIQVFTPIVSPEP